MHYERTAKIQQRKGRCVCTKTGIQIDDLPIKELQRSKIWIHAKILPTIQISDEVNNVTYLTVTKLPNDFHSSNFDAFK
jgi:hypothetical protein